MRAHVHVVRVCMCMFVVSMCSAFEYAHASRWFPQGWTHTKACCALSFYGGGRACAWLWCHVLTLPPPLPPPLSFPFSVLFFPLGCLYCHVFFIPFLPPSSSSNRLRKHAQQHTKTHTQTHARTHTYFPHTPHMHTYIHTYTYTCIQTYIHAYVQIYIHACTHTCIYAYINTCICAYINTQTFEHIHM